jgi:hypothetical protein
MTITASRFLRLLRFALLGLLVVIVVVIGGVALLMAGDKYHWGWTEIPVHYRLSFGVEVGGIPYNGASVVQVTYEQVPGWQARAWIDSPPGGSIYRGQAATLRLPDGKVLCLMTSGQTLVGRKTRNSYADNVVGIANRLLAPLLRSGGRRDMIDTSNAARISGSADIPLDLLPTILLIENPEDPRSTHVFDPERPEQWLGPGARFLGAQIAATSRTADDRDRCGVAMARGPRCAAAADRPQRSILSGERR